MIKTISITNDQSETFDFDLRSPEQSGFFIKNVRGLGPVKATINTSEALSLDGSSFNSARLGERNVVFELGFLENPTIEDTRQSSYRCFPLKSLVQIVIETDNKTVKTEGYVESNEPDIFSKEEGNSVSIICPDPFLHSLTKTIVNFSTIQKLFTFPFSNESLVDKLILFGNILVDLQHTIVYTGEASVGFVIYAHAIGPIHNLSIYKNSTREAIIIDSEILELMTGSDIVSGDDIIISTIKGQKSITLIRDGESFNILNTLDPSSTWFSLDRGNNLFYYLAESGSSNIQFTIEHDLVYEGI